MRKIISLFDFCPPGTPGFNDHIRGMICAYYMYGDKYDVQLHINEKLTISKIFKNIETYQETTGRETRGILAVEHFQSDIETSQGDYYNRIMCVPPDYFYENPDSPALKRAHCLFEFNEPYETQVQQTRQELTGGVPYRVVVCRCGDYAFKGETISESNMRRIIRAIIGHTKADMPTLLICDYLEVARRILDIRQDFIQYVFEPCCVQNYDGPVEGCMPVLTAYRMITTAAEVHNYSQWWWGSSGFGYHPARLFGVPHQGFRFCLE